MKEYNYNKDYWTCYCENGYTDNIHHNSEEQCPECKGFRIDMLPSNRKVEQSKVDLMLNKKSEIEKISKQVLNLETLETRKNDSLDFREQSVWGIKEALQKAYEAGFKAKHDCLLYSDPRKSCMALKKHKAENES
jgi:hypothetical protein